MYSYVSCLGVEILQNRQQNRQNQCVGVRSQNRQNICVGISLKNKTNLNKKILSILPRYSHTDNLSILPRYPPPQKFALVAFPDITEIMGYFPILALGRSALISTIFANLRSILGEILTTRGGLGCQSSKNFPLFQKYFHA